MTIADKLKAQLLANPAGMTVPQLTEAIKHKNPDAVRLAMIRSKGFYVEKWTLGEKGAPAAIWKWAAEFKRSVPRPPVVDPSEQNRKDVRNFRDRQRKREQATQGLTVIRGPWPTNNPLH